MVATFSNVFNFLYFFIFLNFPSYIKTERLAIASLSVFMWVYINRSSSFLRR